ncbi:MAG: hypothetical protein AAB019_11950 [Planctomycetota bacterium]
MFGFLKSNPFYKNKTREEFIEWFSKAKNWNKLNLKIINAIIDKFISDSFAFEVFVHTSENCNLISNNFIPLTQKVPLSQESDDYVDVLLSSFALTLYYTGVLFRDQFIEKMNAGETEIKELSRLLNLSQDSFESALKLNEFLFGAYGSLAFLRGLLNKDEEGLEYCKKGIEKMKKLESIDQDKLTDMQRVSLNDVNFFNKSIIEIEGNLKALRKNRKEERGR